MTRYVLVKDEVEHLEENLEQEVEEDEEEREMLIGRSMDSEPVRDRWIEAVEKILENESLEKGEQHVRRNFDTVQQDGDYGRGEPSRWML